MWTSLAEPSFKFDDDGVYEVKLAFDGDDAELQKLTEQLEQMRDEKLDEIVKDLKANKKAGLAKNITTVDVFTPEVDPETGDETGRIIKNFKMKSSGISKKTNKKWTRKPDIFNAKGVKLPKAPNVGSGSVLKVSFEPYAYYSPKDKEVGVSCRLQAVQIIELVEFGSRDASGYGFEEEDGYDGVPEDDNGGFGDEPEDDMGDDEDFA